MSYNSTHTGAEIDDAVDKVLNGTVPRATKATQDSSGNNIINTYATKVELETAINNLASIAVFE